MEKPSPNADTTAVEDSSDATSSKTLSDLEADEKVSGAANAGGDTGPSPDGQFDESDEKEKAGPM
jgi:hypothetical protein